MVATDNRNQPVVAVLGHYGNRNLGDEAVVAAVLDGFYRSVPGVVPLAVSMDPLDSARRHGIPAFPVRRGARGGPVEDPAGLGPPQALEELSPESGWPSRFPMLARVPRPVKRVLRGLRGAVLEVEFLVRAWHFARRVDLVVVAGSGQLADDLGGPRGYPWTLLKWSLIARLAGARLAFMSVGAGPLDRRISRLQIRLALRMANYVSWRDDTSRSLVVTARHRPAGRVYPDFAFAFRCADGRRVQTVRSIGINPGAFFDGRYWPDADAERYAGYVATMAETIARLRTHGWEPFLFTMQPADRRVIEDVSAALDQTGTGARVTIHMPENSGQLGDVLQRADLLVATSYHGVVLGAACGRPVVAICHQPGARDVTQSVGLGEYAIALDALEIDALVDRVTALSEQVPSIIESIDRAVSAKRIALDEQFAHLADLMDRQLPPAKQRVVEPS